MTEYKKSLKKFESALIHFHAEQKDVLDALDISKQHTREVDLNWASKFSEKLSKQAVDLGREFYEQVFLDSLHQLLLPLADLADAVSAKLDKPLEPIEVVGTDVKLRSQDYQMAFDCLVHLVRNAIDHGVESRDDRKLSGKTEIAHLGIATKLETRRGQDGFVIVFSDDGKGIDVPRIREKLIAKFPQRDWSIASDQDVMMGLFLPGFSSREEVGEFSGRGVGLDAVKTSVENLKGEIQIQSEVGKGTSFLIWLPMIKQQDVQAA